MKITTGAYDPATKSVKATFAEGDVRHSRMVNAVLDDAGAYDKAATRARVDEVGRGVAAKMAIGVIGPDTPAPPVPMPPAMS